MDFTPTTKSRWASSDIYHRGSTITSTWPPVLKTATSWSCSSESFLLESYPVSAWAEVLHLVAKAPHREQARPAIQPFSPCLLFFQPHRRIFLL